MTHLCLNMIVKNESAIIDRALQSVADHIAYWVICDTGSTDNTRTLITEFFQSRGIPGELHEIPFVNFAQTRNVALEYATAATGDFDYILLMDADMELEVMTPDGVFPKELSANGYLLLQKSTGVSYWNFRLVARAVAARYRGVTHEFLDVPGHSERLDAVYFIDHANGASRAEKYDRDIRLLNDGIAAETDPFMIARYQFYLAQTLNESGKSEAALAAYLHRATLGFWDQEIYISLYCAAQIKESLGYPDDDIINSFLAAQEICPDRIEALHGAVHFCRIKGYAHRGYTLAKASLAVSSPVDGLFIEDWIYSYGLLDEFAVNASWAGHYRECLDTCLRILANEDCPEHERVRIAHNAEFALSKLSVADKPTLDVVTHRVATALNAPRVLLAILVKQKETVLPFFLDCIEALDYPKSSIVLHVRTNNNTDNTRTILRRWLDRIGHYYAAVEFDDSDVPESVQNFDVHEWNGIRFKVLGRIRQQSMQRALLTGCQFYFVVDVDNFLCPETLHELVTLNFPIVAPLLHDDNPNSQYSNYHAAIDQNGYYLDCPEYYMLLKRQIKAVAEVPVVHCTYLVRSDVIPQLTYDDGTGRYEYVIFSHSARLAGIPQYLDTRKVYGYLSKVENPEPARALIGTLITARLTPTPAPAHAPIHAPLAQPSDTPLQSLCPSFLVRPLHFDAPVGFTAMNHSVTVWHGRYFILLRTVNYWIENNLDYLTRGGEKFQSRNFLLELDSNLSPIHRQELYPPRDWRPRDDAKFRGWEDGRLFVWQDQLWGIFSVAEYSADGLQEMVSARFELSEGTECRLVDWRVLTPEGARERQKNWMPLVDAETVRFIQRIEPTRIVDLTGKTVREDLPKLDTGNPRGGSQLLAFDGGWLAIVHDHFFLHNTRRYLHYFIWFNREGALCRMSAPFCFLRPSIEFAAGLTFLPDGRLMICFSAYDRESWIGLVDAEEVRRCLAPLPSPLSLDSADNQTQMQHGAHLWLSDPEIRAFATAAYNRTMQRLVAERRAAWATHRAGLPLHRDPAKVWDTFLAQYQVLNHCDHKTPILDAGVALEATFLAGLALLGFSDLSGVGANIYTTHQSGGIHYEPGDITHLLFNDGYFGFIACLNMVGNGIDVKALLREMARILAPNGLLFLSFDYWDEQGTQPRRPAEGGHVLAERDIQLLLVAAQQAGLSPTCTPDFSCDERCVAWLGENYTFANLLLRRTSAANPLSSYITHSEEKMDKNYLDIYVAEYYPKIEGWCSPNIFNFLAHIQQIHETLKHSGGAVEIGIHHGQFFLALNSLCQAEETSIAIDVFDAQNLNIDRSGQGNLAIFQSNLERYDRHHGRNVRILARDSTCLTGTEILTLTPRRPRFFSIDGGHTPEHTVNDLRLGGEVLSDAGVIFLDDIFHYQWPGVIEGFARFMALTPTVVPFALGCGKLFLCRLSFYSYFLQRFTDLPGKIKEVSFFGKTVVII